VQPAATPVALDDVSVSCQVPDLRGRHLSAARRLAHHAGCGIGRVIRHPGGTEAPPTPASLVVRWQSLPSGTVRAPRAKLTIVVAPARHR
jgi:hypothetical protein